MSQRRMFSNRIANSARFLQMPAESQLLYFHMILRADDDGVVEAYPLMKLLGSPNDSFKVLLLKGFVKQLNEDQVVVIMDWLEHNMIRADRKVDSIYKELLLENAPEIKLIEPKPRSDVDDNSRRVKEDGQSVDSPRSAQGRLGKVKLSQGSISKEDSLTERANAIEQEEPLIIPKEKKKPDEFVNQVIKSFEEIMELDNWADSVQTRRRYAKLLETSRKWNIPQIIAILQVAKSHPYHSRWCKMSDIYYKGVELLREYKQKIENPSIAIIS